MNETAGYTDPLLRLIRDHENVSEYVENLEKILQFFYSKEAWEKMKPIETFFRENVVAHFAFEEKVVFHTLLSRLRTPEITKLVDELKKEHAPILELVTEFMKIVSDSASAEDKEARRKLYELSRTIIDRFQEHAAKEDDELVPIIRKNMDIFKYAASENRSSP